MLFRSRANVCASPRGHCCAPPDQGSASAATRPTGARVDWTSGCDQLNVGGVLYRLSMSKGDWERRLPEGVHVESRDRTGFRLGVVMLAGDDGLWPLRCPEHPEDHFFKIEVTQRQTDEASPEVAAEDTVLYCAYCGHSADFWDFAPEQRARMAAAASAAAEQYAADALDEMLGKAFGRQSRSSSRRSGIRIEFKPGRPPSRRQLPEQGEVEQTRRTMQCCQGPLVSAQRRS